MKNTITMANAAVLASALMLTGGLAPLPGQSTPDSSRAAVRTVFASVTDKDGRPVLDMRTEEFEIRNGGPVREFTTRLSTAPLRVALIVADRGSGAFQGGALRFCEALLGHGELSIASLIVQPERLVDFSTSPDALRDGLQRLGRRGVSAQSGAQVMEAILDATKTIRRAGTRPAIVVMRAGGESASSIRPDLVRQALGESGAVLYVAYARNTPEPGRTYFTGDDGANMNRFQGQNVRSDDGEALATVLETGSTESGGRQIAVAGTTMVPAMQQIAAELTNQYEITYARPAGAKPSDRISVSSKRRGVTVRAPSR